MARGIPSIVSESIEELLLTGMIGRLLFWLRFPLLSLKKYGRVYIAVGSHSLKLLVILRKREIRGDLAETDAAIARWDLAVYKDTLGKKVFCHETVSDTATCPHDGLVCSCRDGV